MAIDPLGHAVRRFGMGARPGDLRAIGSDPRGYLLAQLAMPDRALVNDDALAPSNKLLVEQQRLRRERRALKEMAAQDKQPVLEPGRRRKTGMGKFRREAFRDDVVSRLRHGVATEAPFLERLVLFWSNHFCVSAAKGQVRAIAGAYEREAIRPHVLGRFVDMATAAEQHPAMLIYLDNRGSVGPNSRAGRRRGKGLNENLAREILELHTLGVNGGYSQGDVTNLARILTGWTITNQRRHGDEAGKFFFARNRHEPGDWSVLGKLYPNRGRQTGEQVLADLARHRATARHIATKLAKHFLSDKPPPALVERLSRSFLDSDGDLKRLARTLIQSPELWSIPAKKVIPPYDFLVALMRSFDVGGRPRELYRLLKSLGQPPWSPPSPKGWPDGDLSWAGPSAMRERLRIAERVAGDVSRFGDDPRSAAANLFGDGLSNDTRLAIARAETISQGFELLIMSSEFQRR